ncbi:YkgJ family cysteine cluster protein [Siansivirga zeaxanthinifaciens]|uniref:Fe-S-cluster oxidoreductase n=1 Tax=Siansivirga zeaxanthinifaciens CC-SAMT-1 TaxID=1454006 RepID=A0A0C5W8A5_9FLAO|nr:YkgJ family cysteine cluster protein [Siansivirga zeaxanthinifaciens]AJR03413.1 Fe-S-cluster oxidoreductase [Siansivirga zeaxanthinifaciens CC-SAMT-1]
MSIERKVRAVLNLFEQLDLEISEFQNKTHLHCLTGCGNCCTNPSIEASPLEMLPLAFHLFLIGQAESTLAELKTKEKNSLCHLYSSLNVIDNTLGRCNNYKYRGLICRLFGYAATRDKYGKQRLVTCKIIKENQIEGVKNANEAIANGLYVPMFTDYYMQLSQIDFKLGNIITHINQALKLAIEEVLQYYAYRPFPGGLENIA